MESPLFYLFFGEVSHYQQVKDSVRSQYYTCIKRCDGPGIVAV
jgi:hypothetical protein